MGIDGSTRMDLLKSHVETTSGFVATGAGQLVSHTFQMRFRANEWKRHDQQTGRETVVTFTRSRRKHGIKRVLFRTLDDDSPVQVQVE